MNRISWLLRRAKVILQNEGVVLLARQGFPFLLSFFFRYERYYLYVTDIQEVLKERNEVEPLTGIQDFTLKIVSTNEEADELEAEGLEFRAQSVNARKRLDKGAIAFCIFVDGELASLGWVATTQEAKDSVDRLPYKVDFSNRESCTGASMTNPKYRGMGLMGYNLWKRFEFLGQRGKVRDRAAVAKSNIASQRATMRVRTKIDTEARYLKILWWKSWKEKPLEQPSVHPK